MLFFFVRPKALGLVNGQLQPCPPTPNCVSSQTTDSEKRVLPLRFSGAWEAARDRLLGVLKSLPRTKIVTVDGTYVHATCTSRLWRFVDDVECLVDPGASVIHIRSASRVGRYDLEVNRTRLEEIRRAFDRAGLQ
jgi:uncharacterized protein (DUF1499 family)